MILKAVKSSLLTHMAYEDRVLVVRYKDGKQFSYSGVPERLWALLLSACDSSISLGSIFHWTVKAHPDTYPFTEIETPYPLGE